MSKKNHIGTGGSVGALSVIVKSWRTFVTISSFKCEGEARPEPDPGFRSSSRSPPPWERSQAAAEMGPMANVTPTQAVVELVFGPS